MTTGGPTVLPSPRPRPRRPDGTARPTGTPNAYPASRTYGRSAVGLRPILDSDASTRRAQKTAENKKKKDHTPKTGLDKTPLLQG